MSSHKPFGLALSGGGALGGAHIGVLEVLEENGLRPSWVAGSSAGSAVGVAYCAGMSLRRIREVAVGMEWGKLGKVVRPRLGFFDGSRLEASLVELIGEVTFEQLKIPFAAAAADILSDELVILRTGPVAPAVRASCAVPGVFTPVEYQGRLLVDGGLINNLPVGAVRAMGAGYVIAVDVSPPPVAVRKRPNSMIEMWLLSLSILMRNTVRESELADTLICPDVGEFNAVDLTKMPVLIERGREAASAVLPRLLHHLEVAGSAPS